MRVLATSYLIFAAFALLILFLLQIPGVLVLIVVFTMGLGALIVLPVVNFSFWIVAFAPAALGAWVNWRIGVVFAAVILTLALTFPRWLPDPTYGGAALLGRPFSATDAVAVRSIEITSLGETRVKRAIVETAVEALKRNTDLDWIRVDKKVYARRHGILHEVRAHQEDFQGTADVIVTIPSRYSATVWDNAPLSPWRVEDVSGYVIHHAGTNTPLARNLSLKLERAVKPLLLNVTGVSISGSADPKIQFVRAPFGEVVHDPKQTLENDLKKLGLWRDTTDTDLEHGNSTSSPAKSVDAALEEMLLDQKLAQHKGLGNRGPDSFERQVIEVFNAQLEARFGISERFDLIARMERSKIRALDRALIIELATESPALMQRMVDLYYRDLAEDASINYVLQRVVRSEDYAPLARAIGAQRTRFVKAFGTGDEHQREFLINNIYRFEVEDSLAFLRMRFLPRPPGDPLEVRFVEGYQAAWKEEWRRADLLETLRDGYEPNKSDMQEEADTSLLLLLPREDVPRDVLISFVEGWVLTRRSAILHDYDVLLEVLLRLKEVDALELHANLLIYFTDLIEFRPHWKDPPS